MDHGLVRITSQKLLSDNWYVLKKYEFELRRRDGTWQAQTREVYDRGNGATILLYNRARRTVVLIRQFRMPVFVNGHDGLLIESAAGLLDNASPEERIRLEAEEETGYRVGSIEKIYEAFMSPGSVTERIHFFIGEYQPGDRVSDGGGLADEGEDIEVLELGYEQAIAMVERGEIVDGKTIMLLQYLELRLMAPRSLMILLAAPYHAEAADIAALQRSAAALLEAGHVPVLVDGSMAPRGYAETLLERCDAVLRIGGPSAEADAMIALGEQLGRQVFHSLDQVPAVLSLAE